jgi:hypothetical protein
MLSGQVMVCTQPPIQLVPGVKRQAREAKNLHPNSAKVKKTFTTAYGFMAYCLIN